MDCFDGCTDGTQSLSLSGTTENFARSMSKYGGAWIPGPDGEGRDHRGRVGVFYSCQPLPRDATEDEAVVCNNSDAAGGVEMCATAESIAVEAAQKAMKKMKTYQTFSKHDSATTTSSKCHTDTQTCCSCPGCIPSGTKTRAGDSTSTESESNFDGFGGVVDVEATTLRNSRPCYSSGFEGSGESSEFDSLLAYARCDSEADVMVDLKNIVSKRRYVCSVRKRRRAKTTKVQYPFLSKSPDHAVYHSNPVFPRLTRDQVCCDDDTSRM